MEIKNVKKIQIRKSRFNYESESEYYSSCKNHESESEYSGFGEKDSNPNPNPNIRYNTERKNKHKILQSVPKSCEFPYINVMDKIVPLVLKAENCNNGFNSRSEYNMTRLELRIPMHFAT